MNYGDGGFFFLQPLTTPRQVVSSYGDGGFYFLQPLTSPRQVVSSYGAFHGPISINRNQPKSTGPVRQHTLALSEPSKCEDLRKRYDALSKLPKITRPEAQLKALRCEMQALKCSGAPRIPGETCGASSKDRPSAGGNEVVEDVDKDEASLDVPTDDSFLAQYGLYLGIAAGVAVLGTAGYFMFRKKGK